MKILIIEAIPLLSQLFYSLFKKEGFECIQAENLLKGLQNLKMIEFDCIFLDIRSSTYQVNELQQFVKQEKLDNISIFILHNSIEGTIPREGIYASFLKPVQPHILVQRLNNILQVPKTQKKIQNKTSTELVKRP